MTNSTTAGLITKQSSYSAAETISRFKDSVKAHGGTVFTEIDHAAAAAKAGILLRGRTVIMFGNPKGGTPLMQQAPTLAIDLPSKALVWEDDDGVVWLTYNSGKYMENAIYARHGLAVKTGAHDYMERLLEDASDHSTR